jgi:hypothetical protein
MSDINSPSGADKKVKFEDHDNLPVISKLDLSIPLIDD